MKNPTFNSGFLKKDPQYRNKREIFSLKIYKSLQPTYLLLLKNLMLSPKISHKERMSGLTHSTLSCACWSSGM